MNVISIIFAGILLLLAILFWMRSRLVRAMDIFLKISFPLLLTMALLALFIPSIFDSIAHMILEANGTLTGIQNVDSQIASLLLAPQQLVASLGSLFGGAIEPANVSETFLQDSIYPGLIQSISATLRIITIAVSVIGMTVIVYLSYTTTSLAKVVELEKRIKALEASKEA